MSNGNRVIAVGDGERESRRKCVHGVAIRRVSLSIFMAAKPGRDGTDRTCLHKVERAANQLRRGRTRCSTEFH
jgi:hypothetical protein